MKKKSLFVAMIFLWTFIGKGVKAEQSGFILEVWDKKKEHKIIQLPIQSQEVFYLKTIHSLALTPYTHIYKFDEEGNIILSGAVFESGGGGYPVTGDGVLSIENGKFRVDHINRFVGKLLFRVSPISRETLSVSGVEILLYIQVPEGTLIEVKISKGKE
jgi:hypothetical protein